MNYKNTRLTIASAIGALGLFSFASSFAVTSTADLDVTATVTKACSMTTADHVFGAYDPLTGALVSAGSGSITVTCTLLTPYTIALSDGANSIATGVRRMLNQDGGITSNNLLTYTMGCILPTSLPVGTPAAILPANFTGTCTTNWGAPLSADIFNGVGLGPIALPILLAGTLPANQNVAAGTYLDTLTATIEY